MTDNYPLPFLDDHLCVICVGVFDRSWLDFLYWKNTYPTSSFVDFFHIDDSALDHPVISCKNYHYNAPTNHVQASISQCKLLIVIVGDLGSFPSTEALKCLVYGRECSKVALLYLSSLVKLDQPSILQLKLQCNVFIHSDREVDLDRQPDTPVAMLKCLHASDNLMFIAVVESLVGSVFRPDLSIICMDWVDIRNVFGDHQSGYIGCALADGGSRISEVVTQTFQCPMLYENITNANGLYLLIGYGDKPVELAEFINIRSAFAAVMPDYACLVIGLRYNKYLQGDEVQLVVLATKNSH